MIQSKLIPNGKFNNSDAFQKPQISRYALMKQFHSDIVVEVRKPGTYKADGIITEEKKLAVVVQTADCMPVLMYDEKKVGALHIGWRGLENRIFSRSLKYFNLSNLKVSIGPHAQKCCYEVKEDLESNLSLKPYCISKDKKIFLNLSNAIIDFCRMNNWPIEVSEICTICNEKYNSYRRDQTNERQWSFAWI
tara:strand:- start:569 stop:1144 length:576 start_codon:yes stop_codon:yes gene_type:complete